MPFYLEIHNEKWVYLLKNWQAGHIQQFAEYIFTQKYIQQKFIVLLSTLETHTHTQSKLKSPPLWRLHLNSTFWNSMLPH